MKAWIIPVLSALLLGCGGGGGSSAQEGPVAFDPEGIYSGSVSSKNIGQLSAWAAVTPSGEVRYVDWNGSGDFMALANITTAAGTGSGTLYPGQGIYGSGISSITLQGITGAAAGSTSGSYTVQAGDTGTFSFTYNSVYTRPQALAAFAGYYTETAAAFGHTPGTFSIDASGNITDVGNFDSSGSGTLVQLDPSKNLYRVTLSYTDGNNYTGLAFWTDNATTNLTPNSLYIQITGTNTSNANYGIFTKN